MDEARKFGAVNFIRKYEHPRSRRISHYAIALMMFWPKARIKPPGTFPPQGVPEYGRVSRRDEVVSAVSASNALKKVRESG